MRRAAIVAAAVLATAAIALAQSGLPPMHVEVGIPSWQLGVLVVLISGLAGIVWAQLNNKLDRGFAQLHARIGELKADHGEEIKGLRSRSHDLAGHVAAIDAKISMHLDGKGA